MIDFVTWELLQVVWYFWEKEFFFYFRDIFLSVVWNHCQFWKAPKLCFKRRWLFVVVTEPQLREVMVATSVFRRALWIIYRSRLTCKPRLLCRYLVQYSIHAWLVLLFIVQSLWMFLQASIVICPQLTLCPTSRFRLILNDMLIHIYHLAVHLRYWDSIVLNIFICIR